MEKTDKIRRQIAELSQIYLFFSKQCSKTFH
nr:MAG TPA: hypothetical protein [Caudoviricetes sp.]